MPTTINWQLPPASLDDDEAFLTYLVEMHRRLSDKQFIQDPIANQELGIQVRAFRRIEYWRLLLILTPWMLARILSPLRAPQLEIPQEWSAENRAHSNYQIMGPGVNLELLDQKLAAHINYDPTLGHYLLQPLVLNMEGFSTPEAVFQAWNQVIRTRDANMEKMKRDCPWQKEVSRREFFRGRKSQNLVD